MTCRGLLWSMLPLIVGTALLPNVRPAEAQLGELMKPHEGRSRRATSTRREGPDGRYDPKAPPRGDRDE